MRPRASGCVQRESPRSHNVVQRKGPVMFVMSWVSWRGVAGAIASPSLLPVFLAIKI